jgi:NitT/TauT family transport system substrate-binding protein
VLRRSTSALLGLLLVATLLTACTPAAPAGPTPVSMRLQWYPQWQFAGYYVAEARGYYDEAGLAVTIGPGSPDLVSLPLVAAGQDTFGSTGADTILIAREQGIDVVALATWFQASPVAFMVHADSGITTPQDFVGRRVGMFYGDNVETEYRALLAAAGVDAAQISEVPADYSLAPFLERTVDVWPVYATDQPNLARAAGAEVELILARDYGVELMGDVLFTTAEFARNNPQIVNDFVAATARGWREAIADPQAAITLLREINPDLSAEQLAFEAAETITLLQYGIGADCPGAFDQTRWQGEADLLLQLGILSSAADLDTALASTAIDAYYQSAGITCRP